VRLLWTHQEKILEITPRFQLPQCVFTAVELGIPHQLKTAKSYQQLAQEINANYDALYRFLNALTVIGLVVEMAEQQFQVTELAQCLQEDNPDSIKSFILLRAEQNYLCWKNLTYSIKTGKSAFEYTFGMNRYLCNQHNPTLSAQFDLAMSELAQRQKQAILSSYDFRSSIV
jgi:hypothetical protein